MEAYKGIKKSAYPKWEGWYWLSTYCKNHDEKILENDIVLQSMVKAFYLKRRIKILVFSIAIWGALAYLADTLTKG